MLHKSEILTKTEKEAIQKGLQEIKQEIEDNSFHWSIALEDIHMNIEAALISKIGDDGKKLHTARSRNDQVATDIRLYMKASIKDICQEIKRLQNALLNLAENHINVIMPGFTHLQSAQPISFAHHMMAWFEMLKRDYSRMQDCLQRLNECPLGSAALAGSSFPIDRKLSASLLGFSRPCENSLDAVSDRDFAMEFCAHAAICMTHLSRFSEEIILWSSAQFDFIELPDRFCTGSSIMPQKKNPDVPELIRGKTGRSFGNLTALLTLMKGQALAYNKDNQEDKEPLFDSVTTLSNCLKAYADMIPHIQCKTINMYEAAKKGFSTATDLADYLVKKGLTFRDAHEIVGNAVKFSSTYNKDLSELELEALQQFAPEHIGADVFSVLSLEGSIKGRNHIGGTAPKQVKKAIKRAKKYLEALI